MAETVKLAQPPPATVSEYAQKRFDKWRTDQEQLYNDPYVRVLLLGLKGDGKTTTLATARKPIVINSFTPSGTLSIKHEVEKQDGIYVVSKYEGEDLRKPTAFAEWERDFMEDERNGLFNDIGTYCIDDGYLWMEALLAKQRYKFHGAPIDDMLADSQVKGKDLRNLYGFFLEANLYWTRKLLSIPCNVIFTCHIDRYVDPVTGEQGTSILAPGMASKERVPVPFPEVWIKQRKDNEHWLLVSDEGRWKASTRIGAKAKLTGRQPADICGILRKCGLPTEPRGVSA